MATWAATRSPARVSSSGTSRCSKDFNISEQHKVQFRFEAFNFPNHPNWGNPNTNVSSGGNFGRITGTRNNMRNLQFALKYMF
jgi:hypothetical protein